METQDISRRTLLKNGAAAMAGMTVLQLTGPTRLIGQTTGEVLPWVTSHRLTPFRLTWETCSGGRRSRTG